MANDRAQYRNAVEKWSDFNERGVFSKTTSNGTTAIISADSAFREHGVNTGISDVTINVAKSQDEQSQEVFNKEAKALGKLLGHVGIKTEVITDARVADLVEAIMDPTISDLTIIGHGGIAGIYIRGKLGTTFFDWYKASSISNHLKRGRVTQRFCGVLNRNLNVAFGTFLVNNLQNVDATFGELFMPASLDDPVNQNLRPVYNSPTPPRYTDLPRKPAD